MDSTQRDRLKESIRAEAARLGFDSVGFSDSKPAESDAFYRDWLAKGYHGTMGYLQRQANLKRSPQSLLEGAKTVIAVSLNYNQPNPRKAGQPLIARYALGRDYHKVLRAMLKQLASFVETQIPGTKHRVCVDSAPIHEREYANRAGLGWFGKNTMLIDSKRGSWFVIGLLLTTLELEPDQPAVGACGKCTKCIDACPTEAIINENGRWQIDARRCISYLTIEHKGQITQELEQKIAPWTFGCDVCQEVCPFNQERESQPERAPRTQVVDFLNKREWPTLEELATISESQWDVLTRGSPVRRTGLDSLRRIAHVGLAKPRGKT